MLTQISTQRGLNVEDLDGWENSNICPRASIKRVWKPAARVVLSSRSALSRKSHANLQTPAEATVGLFRSGYPAPPSQTRPAGELPTPPGFACGNKRGERRNTGKIRTRSASHSPRFSVNTRKKEKGTKQSTFTGGKVILTFKWECFSLFFLL